jgi:glycosyltransferase involved in cell wall biosynthesis/GT2 family glycosyltransferase
MFRDGKWTDTTEQEVKAFIEGLTKPRAVDEEALVKSVNSQMAKLSSKILLGSKNLAEANTSFAKAASKALSSSSKSVDIIVPVYGGLRIVSKCLENLEKYTDFPHRIIVVEDCSPDGGRTRSWLEDWSAGKRTVLYNQTNKGFPATVNRGIREGGGDYICILNSDVLVTPRWLSKLVLALELDDKNQIVNPVTNNTAVIGVPFHPGRSYYDMNRALEAMSTHRCPEIMPTGFCYMFRRSLIPKIGHLDESYQMGYGEETDHWMNVISYVHPNGTAANYRAVLADDTYVYHERGSSFSILGEEKHMGARKAGNTRFHNKWPQYTAWVKASNLEESVRYLRTQLPEKAYESPSPYNIAFVTFSTGMCGGMAFITDIVNELVERGINAKVIRVLRDKSMTPLPTMEELRTGVVEFKTPEEFVSKFTSQVFSNGIVVSATAEIAPLCNMLCAGKPNLNSLLLAQSYDPMLTKDPELQKRLSQSYIETPNVLCNSEWLNNTVKSLKGNSLGFVWPGVDNKVFYPRDRKLGDDRPTVAFLLRSDGPYRGMERGINTAKEIYNLAEKDGRSVRLLAFGVGAVKGASFLTCYGTVPPNRLADILGREVDVVVDPAYIHSYGMFALEGMASACVPVTWNNCGIEEYATHGKNAVILPRDLPSDTAAKAIYDLLFHKDLDKFKWQALLAANEHTRVAGVNEVISTIEKTFKVNEPKKKISVITPHIRKHGGPTTIVCLANTLKELGHEVTLYTIHTDVVNSEIVRSLKIDLNFNWKDIPDCDLLITNSDNEHNEFFSSLPNVKKKVLFKLSHNPRFFSLEDNALKLPWDDIWTSTSWLVNACKTPIEGWTHGSREAKRLGWYHYGHDTFAVPPDKRKYLIGGKLNIYTLIHQHPLKGTNQGLETLRILKSKYPKNVEVYGLGEWPGFEKPDWMSQYWLGLSRSDMAKVLKTMDIFVSSSLTEGLGRMCLEAMSAGVAVVKFNTEAEFARDGETCIITEPNVEALVAGVEGLITNPSLFNRVVRGGYTTAAGCANPNEYVNNLKEYLRAL